MTEPNTTTQDDETTAEQPETAPAETPEETTADNQTGDPEK